MHAAICEAELKIAQLKEHQSEVPTTAPLPLTKQLMAVLQNIKQKKDQMESRNHKLIKLRQQLKEDEQALLDLESETAALQVEEIDLRAAIADEGDLKVYKKDSAQDAEWDLLHSVWTGKQTWNLEMLDDMIAGCAELDDEGKAVMLPKLEKAKEGKAEGPFH